MEEIIKLINVNFSYGSNNVLKNLNLQVNKGEFLGLIGPNGSGKSSILKIMLGFLRPQSGEVLLFNTPIDKFREWNKIGYVSQKANSFNRGFPATVYEVVSMGLFGKKGLFRFLNKKDQEKIYQAIELVGLKPLVKRNISKLSGGQQQRVFIARALVNNPELLILDEPTVGVDTETVRQFYNLLEKLNQDFGITIILVSHDIGVISKQVNRIACLNKELVFHGKPEDFEKNRGILQKTYGEEMGIIDHHHLVGGK